MSRFTASVPEDSAILCEGCGYIVSGLPGDSRCPECAKPIAESLGSKRRPSLWEQDQGPAVTRFLRTTAQVVFTPKAFFRGLAPRGPVERSKQFARVHLTVSTFLFGATALLQFQWIWGQQGGTFWLLGPLFWVGAWVFVVTTTGLAARLSAWESAYRGLRLPLPVVTRALHYHSAHYLPVALVAFATVAGYQVLLASGVLTDLVATRYLYLLCAEVILAAAYLFKTYWTGMRNLMYANN